MDPFKDGKGSGAQFESPKRRSAPIRNWMSSPQRKSRKLSQSQLFKNSSENQLYRLQNKSKLFKRSSKVMVDTRKTGNLLRRYSSKPTKLDLFFKKYESKSTSVKPTENKSKKSIWDESSDSDNNVSSSKIFEKSGINYFKTIGNSTKNFYASRSSNKPKLSFWNESTDSEHNVSSNSEPKKKTKQKDDSKNDLFDKIISVNISKSNKSLEVISISSDSDANISTTQTAKFKKTRGEPFFQSIKSPIADSPNIFENEENIILKMSQATSTPEESKTPIICSTKENYSPKRKRINEYFKEIKRVSQNRNMKKKISNVTEEITKPLKAQTKSTVVIAECDSTSNYSDSSLTSKTSSKSKSSYSAIFRTIDALSQVNSVNKKTVLVSDSIISVNTKVDLPKNQDISCKSKEYNMDSNKFKKVPNAKNVDGNALKGKTANSLLNESVDGSVFISVSCFEENTQDEYTKKHNTNLSKYTQENIEQATGNLNSYHQRNFKEAFKTITSQKLNLRTPKSFEKIKNSCEYVEEKVIVNNDQGSVLKNAETNFVLRDYKEVSKINPKQQFSSKTTDILSTRSANATHMNEKVNNWNFDKDNQETVLNNRQPNTSNSFSKNNKEFNYQQENQTVNILFTGLPKTTVIKEEVIFKDDQELLAELARFDNIRKLYEKCNIDFNKAEDVSTEKRDLIEIIEKSPILELAKQDMKITQNKVKKLKQNKQDKSSNNNISEYLSYEHEQTQQNKAEGTTQIIAKDTNPNKKGKKSYNIDPECLLYEENMLNYLASQKKKIIRGLEVGSNCESEEKVVGAYIKRYTKGDTKIFKIQPRFKKPEYKFSQPEENWEKILRVIEDQVSDDESVERERILTPTSYKTDDDKSEILSTGSGKLPPPQKMLRSGINRISKDKNLIFNKNKDIVSKEFNKSQVKIRICEILLDSVQRFETGKIKEMKWPADDLTNCVFADDRYQLSQNPRLSVITYEQANRRIKYNLTLLILNKIRELLQNKTKLTKRELFYQLKPMITEQRISDRVIYEISRMLRVGMWALNLTSQKGLVFGNMKLVMSSGEVVNCNVPGTLIPADVTDITEIQSTAYFILVVEKDSIFNKLIEEDLPNRLTRPFIMITGKGFPDLNTQLFLKKLWMIMAIPVFVLVDPDPHGIGIMINYRFGSVANSHVSDHLAVPKSRWLGVLPSEINTLSLPAEKLTEKDTKMLKKMLTMECVKRNPKIEEEIEKMLEISLKASIEGLIKNDTYLSNVYLSHKFFNNRYI